MCGCSSHSLRGISPYSLRGISPYSLRGISPYSLFHSHVNIIPLICRKAVYHPFHLCPENNFGVNHVYQYLFSKSIPHRKVDYSEKYNENYDCKL